MHVSSRLVVSLAILLAARIAEAAAGKLPEWADKRLPRSNGLILWLDASTQPTAARAHGAKQINSGDALEYWYDASGFERHVRQTDAKARPTLRIDKTIAAIRFRG